MCVLSLSPSPHQDDRDFRDKITPISVMMLFTLDQQQAADKTGLKPILDPSAPNNVTKQVTERVCVCEIRLEWTEVKKRKQKNGCFQKILLCLAVLPFVTVLPRNTVRATMDNIHFTNNYSRTN